MTNPPAHRRAIGLALFLATLTFACDAAPRSAIPATKAARQRVIVMVWDGLRPDSINPVDTPNLYALRMKGVDFVDNHATYPTFTMMNAASFATGAFAKTAGFYGNYFWTPPQPGAASPIPVGKGAAGKDQDYVGPVFTEDYAVLTTLDEYYDRRLLLVKSLFAIAQEAGLTTFTLGKSGPAYLQDLGRRGLFADENALLPKTFEAEIANAGFALPANARFASPDGASQPAASASPTARADPLTFTLPNGVQARDATDTTQGAPEEDANAYLLRLYTDYVLPKKKPDLAMIWFRTPDNSEHAYGPGAANYRRALASQDARLGDIQAALKKYRMDTSTNIVVVSDHAHSNVSGPTRLYPLRAIVAQTTAPRDGKTDAKLGAPDPVGGFSVSGDVRAADLLTFAGFKAFDGNGCQSSPMSGIRADGTTNFQVASDDSGDLCDKAKPGTRFQAVSASLAAPVASFKVPKTMPPGGVVVAANGGSDYFYVPDHDPEVVARLVRFLQSREEYGAIFVDSRFGELPGTLSLAQINVENATRRDRGQPDIVASFSWDAQQLVNGMPGTEFESNMNNRGMHGSFSPIDVHNTMVASGPSFRRATVVATPTGNVDLAPTVARLLGLAMPDADGRVLDESLAKSAPAEVPRVRRLVLHPSTPARSLAFRMPTDPGGASADPALPHGNYSINLVVKDLTVGGRTYRYFDYAQAVRD